MSEAGRRGRSDTNQPTHAERQQQRPAVLAWQWVSQAADHGKAARYGTLARKLPSMLQVSGLGQTLAFLYSKGYEGPKPKSDSAEALLFRQLGGYLIELSKQAKQPDAAMEALLSLSPGDYRAVTRQLSEVAGWIKRFAEGRLAHEKDQ
ncbi:MAG: type III-B CRISPR module-associated protein Cmr5 [Kofleriaceae bacterium]